MAHIRTDDPAFPVFCQLVAAFGQGAGTMNIAGEAMSLITTQYWPAISQQSTFDQTLLQGLEYARGLGRLAAQRALAAGYNVVRTEDLQSAAAAFDRSGCPYCLQESA